MGQPAIHSNPESPRTFSS